MKSAFALFAVLLGVTLVGCGKKDDGAAPAASASAAAVAVPTVAVPATTTTTPTANPADAASISTCCAALRSESSKAKPADQGKYTAAAAVCDGIAGLVRSGRTGKAAALGQIRAALHGDSLPPGCN